MTSQFFANLYLDDLDHWLKETLRVPAYLRYVDDLLLLDDDKRRLWAVCAAIEERLESLRLRLHPRKRQVQRTADFVDVLGYQVRRDRRRLRNDNGLRFRRRLRGMAKSYGRWRIGLDEIDASVQSWIGHARHAAPKRFDKTSSPGYAFGGNGPDVTGGRCAAGRGTTNRRMCARPTATGTTQRNGTTTSASV